MLIVWPTRYELSSSFGMFIPIDTGYPQSPTPTQNYTTYTVNVDWDGDGDFSEASENISADVKWCKFIRGFDQERGKAVSGRCELRLRNETGTYTPSLHASIKPGRLVQISTTQGGAYTLYTGYIEEITPHPDWSTQDCYVTCIDGMDFLARGLAKLAETDTSTFQSDAQTLLTNASWPNMAAIDIDGITNPASLIPNHYSAFETGSVRDALELLATGCNGRTYIDRRGYLTFETRDHRTLFHSTPVYTFDNNMVSIQTTSNTRNIYNHVEVEYKIKTTGPLNSDIWHDGNYRSIQIYQYPYTYYATFDQEYTGVSFDLTYYQGGGYENGTSVTVNYGKTATCTVTRGIGSPTLVTDCVVSGYPSVFQSSKAVSDDTTSQTSYHKRDYAIPDCFLDEVLARLKDPHPDLQISFINDSPEKLTQILNLDVSDRVHVHHTLLGIDADYFIEYHEHTISEAGLIHQAIYRLSPA
jgi:hypothetical protein